MVHALGRQRERTLESRRHLFLYGALGTKDLRCIGKAHRDARSRDKRKSLIPRANIERTTSLPAGLRGGG